MQHVIEITFDQTHAFGSFEKRLSKEFGNNYSGSGTFFGDKVSQREVAGSFSNKKSANAFVKNAKKIAKEFGVEINVSTFSY
jgi:hypothetical protein